MNNYEDIINHEHHISKYRKRMSMENRAAQFAPFAALTGYEESLKEKARITDKKIELTNELKEILNQKINILINNIDNKPYVKITYFKKDLIKDGGEYINYENNIKKIIGGEIIFVNSFKIKFDDILSINSDLFNNIY